MSYTCALSHFSLNLILFLSSEAPLIYLFLSSSLSIIFNYKIIYFLTPYCSRSLVYLFFCYLSIVLIHAGITMWGAYHF